MSDNWNAEDIFIQLMLDTSITLDDLENCIKYLSTHSSKFCESYKIWVKCRDVCLSKLKHNEHNEHINFNRWPYKSVIDGSELKALHLKISTDELTILKRMHNVCYNEMVHNADELWDDR